MKSAPNSLQAKVGSTQAIPPSFSICPSRITGRRKKRIAQLALTAEESFPSVIVTACLLGNSVAIAAKGSFKCEKFSGKYFLQKDSSLAPFSRLGQNTERAISAISCHSKPAAIAAPIRLPTLVPVTTEGFKPTSASAFITPIWARPRTAPPLKARPIRSELSL